MYLFYYFSQAFEAPHIRSLRAVLSNRLSAETFKPIGERPQQADALTRVCQHLKSVSCFGCSVQTDHLSVIHTCSSDDTAACLGMIKGLFHSSSSLMSGYFVRNEDKRVKDVKDMYLYARCSKRHLAFFSLQLPSPVLSFLLSPIIRPRRFTPPVTSHYSELRFRSALVHFPLRLLLSFTDQFAAVPGRSQHPPAGPLGPLCGPSAQDQRQPGRPPPGERRPVRPTADVAG